MRRLVVLLLLVTSCVAVTPDLVRVASGRLSARPHKPSLPCAAGVQSLGLDSPRDALLYVPESVAAAKKPAPLLLFLHGATGQAARSIARVRPLADTYGVILLAPNSRKYTWDGIFGPLGPDVAFVDRALQATFDRCSVDRSKVGVGGFSDGASYALSLGIANGDFFDHVMAFSPCLVAKGVVAIGRPLLFVSHGRADDVLPIATCGRPLAAALRKLGYNVRYEEFEGTHEVPTAISGQAFKWFLGPRSEASVTPASLRE